mmetsp:Transcript_18841/g.52567  ORF Transcript_18841/g.52567 Transcript_18841/m.52567 type:complete len:386 (+) Transcript_18841:719-1876(+)
MSLHCGSTMSTLLRGATQLRSATTTRQHAATASPRLHCVRVHARRSAFSGRRSAVSDRSSLAVAGQTVGLGWDRDLEDRIQVLPSQVLGEGTSGIVMLGLERDTGRRVAVKAMSKLRSGVSVGQRALSKMAEEVALLERVQQCPNVIELVGKWEDDENAYVVTELCAEGDLAYLTTSLELDESEVAQVARDMLAVLAECHAQNIAHCDVKPENFVVDKRPDGRRIIKAVDFGCGQIVQDGIPLRDKTGTPLYRAPEMYARNYGLEADLWATGMIIYQMITGQFCFWGNFEECTPHSVMDAVLNQDVTFDDPGWAMVSPEAIDLVKKLLQRDPSKRITAAEALQHQWFDIHCAEIQVLDTAVALPALVGNVVPKPPGMSVTAVQAV